MKLQRYDPPRSFPTKPLPWRQSDDGDWCNAEDVAELEAVNAELLAALRDMYSGWQYIRQVYGDLYGVGWERCDMHARAAIAKAEVKVMP